ncbi:phospholipid scramblase 3-like [Leptodactylus fuscus]|uniref:phospholipid scramblase 3-like n=1 Tax=Leptodactylus fuscus TaxID=238119 RepID=UPI003F4EDC0B
MDPHSTGYTWNKNSETVQTQPQWQDTSALSHQSHLYNPRAVVPPGLECLVEVEEVTLQDKAFFISSGQTLFTIRRESECCGPAFNLRLQNSKRRVMVLLRAESGEGCCGGESYLKITVLPETTIGFIKCSCSSRQMNISIQMEHGEPAFTAELSLSRSKQSTIEILNVKDSCPVATITKEGENKSSNVIFQFPIDMDTTLKVLILAAFLYMKHHN